MILPVELLSFFLVFLKKIVIMSLEYSVPFQHSPTFCLVLALHDQGVSQTLFDDVIRHFPYPSEIPN